MVEFNRWKGSGQGSEWVFRHYKGLGTNTDEEAKAYFTDLQSYKREFLWEDDGNDEEAINLAFSDNAEKRRTWLNTYEVCMIYILLLSLNCLLIIFMY